MKNGTREDYELLERLENEYCRGLPDRLLAALRGLENTLSGTKYRGWNIPCSRQPAPRPPAKRKNM